MLILGLNAYHGDSSACIIKDGVLLAAVEEERFTRIKHWAGYPKLAIDYCLATAGATLADVDHIAVNRDPRANVFEKIKYTLRRMPSVDVILDRLRNASKIGNIRADIAGHFGIAEDAVRAPIHHVEHHLAHLASAFFVSPFRKAAVLSTDGFGDFVGAMWASGEENTMTVHDRVYFPHSLGLFYLTLTQYLGFPYYGDEYKVMGLASYGTPDRIGDMRKIVSLAEGGKFELTLDFFNHATNGISMTWENGRPDIGVAFTPALEEFLGPARKKEDPIEQKHINLAASMQAMYEEAFFHMVDHVQALTGSETLCLAGGTAMNSVANGKLFARSAFKDVYIQSAAGDSGGALGAAYHVWNQELAQPRGFVMEGSYWGPEYTDDEIASAVSRRGAELEEQRITVET